MKKVGIALDSFKLKKFKQELNKAGFTDLKTSPMAPGITFISLEVEDEKVKQIANILRKCQIDIKLSN
jgi:nitrogen regulatory protein PII